MTIAHLARQVAKLLAQHQLKVCFAESCTGGLVSGALTAVPGISAWHCGGVVVYRNETKQALLKIPASLLKDPGPVSDVVACRMAEAVLLLIPEADISVAVTGHLGPGAPPELDGLVYLAVGERSLGSRRAVKAKLSVTVQELRLAPDTKRVPRQKAVVEAALQMLVEAFVNDR